MPLCVRVLCFCWCCYFFYFLTSKQCVDTLKMDFCLAFNAWQRTNQIIPLRCYEFLFSVNEIVFAAQKTSCKYLNTLHLTFTSSPVCSFSLILLLFLFVGMCVTVVISSHVRLYVDMNARRERAHQSNHIKFI